MTRRAREEIEREDDDEGIDEGDVAVEVEGEDAEDRLHHHALEPVVAARHVAPAVGELVARQPDAERHHEQRDAVETRDQQAAHGAERARAAIAAATRPRIGSPNPCLARTPAV